MIFPLPKIYIFSSHQHPLRQPPHLALTSFKSPQNGQKQTPKAPLSRREIKAAKTQPIDSSFRDLQTLFKTSIQTLEITTPAPQTHSPIFPRREYTIDRRRRPLVLGLFNNTPRLPTRHRNSVRVLVRAALKIPPCYREYKSNRRRRRGATVWS